MPHFLMKTFAKSQVASSLSAFADYCVTVFLVEITGIWYVVGNAIGTAVGGIINFNLNRKWAFSKGLKRRRIQFMRYTLVWTGYMLLTSLGVFMLTHFFNVNYLVSKLIISLGLALGYNYPLQKSFVFK